jgi:hypothetical protein
MLLGKISRRRRDDRTLRHEKRLAGIDGAPDILFADEIKGRGGG